MALHRAQCILPMFTNLPEDVIVNQFHFEVLNVSSAAGADEIATRLGAFYTNVYGAGSSTRVGYIDWTQARVKVFNMDDAPPRVPEERALVVGGGTTGTATTTIPTEVATVLSFHAEPVSGVPFQRLYNRIYLGGMINVNLVNSATDEFPRLSGAWIGSIINAAQLLLVENDFDVMWMQRSEAGGGATRPIVGGWVDNSPDTQRRRSVLATQRNTWSPLP